ncbi:MAG: sodium:proton antiporter [Nitrospiraceae bacterium]|nr:MAG: sodium:proton antiporter [Nitrospiraceae bacterium]
MQSGHSTDLGEVLTLWSTLPFAGMLLSIALFPLFAPRFWHHHFGKISAFWALVVSVPFLYLYRGQALYEFLHIVLADYVPFVIILTALYTVSGNILLRGTLVGTPAVNTGMLLIGTVLASWMGTTGASMLLIRPFLRANSHRKNRTFMVVFFIFLVSNVGGSLTPLGDPPLFLGFLRGVPFFWTFKLFWQMLCVVAVLLTLYFIMDSYFYRREDGTPATGTGENVPLSIDGAHNFIFLAGIIGAVFMSGVVHLGEVTVLGIHRPVQDLLRDGILILMALLSLATTRREIREDNEFTWFPMQEVAILFIGIFLTMMPCLKILQAGEKGHLAVLIRTVQEPYHYFWVTGVLSSFLDNAPTYLTFLSSLLGKFYAGTEAREAVGMVINGNSIYLKAISAGAVFFGANTYIGNAPNFMVRSIAEETGTPMPSFFGYMIKYSIPILVPCFLMITLLFYL